MITFPIHTSNLTLQQAGGKGANLCKLAALGLPVPSGFIISTQAFNDYVRVNHLGRAIESALKGLAADDLPALERACAAIQAAFTAGKLSVALHHEITSAYNRIGGSAPVAVRSSATTEDLPDLSFAGQQDTFLNIIGEEAVLQAVVGCWASLFTARAIGYRMRNNIPHLGAALAVVVQQMVPADVSGVLFTANPLSGLLSESVINATFGLGEALVSGQVEPDQYLCNNADGAVKSYTLGSKARASISKKGGGIQTLTMRSAERKTLDEAQAADITLMGQKVQAGFGSPQDIEFAFYQGNLFLLQSRPITTLYPIPLYSADPLIAWFSFGAVQGLVGPITPLGQESIQQVVLAMGKQLGSPQTLSTQTILASAGERLWTRMSDLMRNPIGAKVINGFVLGYIEPGAASAFDELNKDPNLRMGSGRLKPATMMRLLRFFAPIAIQFPLGFLNPKRARQRFDDRVEAFLATVRIPASGPSRYERLEAFIRFMEGNGGLADALPTIGPLVIPMIGPAMGSLALLNKLSGGAAGGGFDPLVMDVTRGLPNNVTTEMDLALWATAKAILADEESKQVIANTPATLLASEFLARRLPHPAQVAIQTFMDHYGMRGVGEIDLGQTRWREDPTPVMYSLQSYLNIPAEAAPDVVFANGQAAADAAVEKLCQKVGSGFGGWFRKKLVRAAALRIRTLMGARESPKFTAIRAMGMVRAELLSIGEEFVAAGNVLRPQDLFFLTIEQLKALATPSDATDWKAVVAARRAIYDREELRRRVPRLLVSDGRVFYDGMPTLETKGDDRQGFNGSPVSAGVVEGVVRIVLDPRLTRLEAGEILVCPGTDPAWTPLFMVAGGLITEVGGMMTHGSVVAREYGIPAVVGVTHATLRLQTGQRIRLNGSTGEITVLE